MADFASLANAPMEQLSLRKQIERTLASINGVVKASLRPIPTQTGDGSCINPPASEGLLQDLRKMGIKDAETLVEVFGGKVSGKPTNDRTYLIERVIQLASELPPASANAARLSGGVVDTLWNTLQHPPLSFLGEKSKYRQADGSYNNIMYPRLGAANTPYARTVQPRTIQPSALPDPGDLFDSVMVRKKFIPHPNKISSVLFYLASIIIHDLFRTDHADFSNSLTSSYLDLAPLYGSNQEEQNTMRTFKDGRIKTDCFAEKRLLQFPPGVGVLLISFNRFHNYVVQQLALINESGRFTKPKEDHADVVEQYDNDLFQTGRLITCGLYVNCILKDYVRTILNLNRTNSVWNLDPRLTEGKTFLGGNAAQGVGNQVSAEFNLVYRWHAAVSERDDNWTQDAYRRLFPGKKPKDVGLAELVSRLSKFEESLSANPQERPFANLQRNDDGTLNDNDLVKILTESIEDIAGSFGANRVPEVLRAVEILGIMQARSWNLATLNEFRDFLGLTKHETFEDINSDPEVAEKLRHLYDHPDYVELYPGLVAEEAKVPMVPGSGLCPSFTVSRAVLSDAVALVRGDRFYTVDYTPNNLTHWGYNEVNYDVTVDQGQVFYKLLIRAFPNHFKQNSVYAHFPLVIPSENKVVLTKLGLDMKYSWDRPTSIPQPTLVVSYNACKTIVNNQKDFKVMWGESTIFLVENSGIRYGADYMLSGDASANSNSRKIMGSVLYRDGWHQEIQTFYEKITIELLLRNSYKIADSHQVDIVRDVGNIAHTHFSAEVFSLPLKTVQNPKGVYSERELYTVLALVFTCIFYDADPAKSFALRQAARIVTQQLGKLVQTAVEPINASGFLAGIIERCHSHTSLSNYGVHMIQQLLKSGLGVKDVVWSQILPTAAAMVANQGQLFAQCLDYYLSDEGKPHLKEINRLAKVDTKEADELLLHYFMEGARLRSSGGVYREVATPTTLHDGDKTLNLQPGQRVMADFVTASHDPLAFPNPENVDLTRPLDSYIHYGMGPHQCLGRGISQVAMTTMLKVVGKLENLRRAPGPQGEIKKIVRKGGFVVYLTEGEESYWPFPASLKVRWDGEVPGLKG